MSPNPETPNTDSNRADGPPGATTADNRDVVRERFGAHAADYATSTVHAKGASLERLLDLTRPEPAWRVLDIATGAGHTALAFAPHVAEVIATDITPQMLQVGREIALERGLSNVRFSPADASDLPFPDGSFDLVSCRIAPHHFPDVGAFVAESARVLKAGGLLAVVDNLVQEDSVAAQFVNDFERLRDPGHVACLSAAQWRAHFAAQGLAVCADEARPKDIRFDSWVARQGLDAETTARLRAMLDAPPGSAAEFLQPRTEEGGLVFTLSEGLFVARKSG